MHSRSPRPGQLASTTAERRFRVGVAVAVVFVVVGAVYWKTAAVTLVSYSDSAELVTTSYTLGIPHAPGYPLYMMLGRLFSSLVPGDVAHRYSLLCGLFGACTVALLFVTSLAVGSGWLGAAVASLSLAFAYHFWLYSLVPEVSSLSGLFTALALGTLLWGAGRRKLSRRRIELLALVLGLGLTHHHTLLLLVPGAAYFVLRERERERAWRFQDGMRVSAFLVAGLLPYLYLPWAAARSPAINFLADDSFTGICRFISRAEYGGSRLVFAFEHFSAGVLARTLGFYWQCLVESFTPVGVALGLLGFAGWWRSHRSLAVCIGVSFIVAGPALFMLSRVPLSTYEEKGVLEKFLLPSCVLLALSIGGGVRTLSTWAVARGPAVLRTSPLVLAVVSGVLFMLLPLGLLLGNYTRVDKSHFRLSRMYALDLFKCLDPNALVLIHGDSSLFSCWYLQKIDGHRPDVEVVGIGRTNVVPLLRRAFGRRPVDVVGLPGDAFARYGLDGNPLVLVPRGLVMAAASPPLQVPDDTRLWGSFEFQKQAKTTDLADWYAKETVSFYASAHYNRAVILLRLGAIDPACRDVREARDIDPEYAVHPRFLTSCGQSPP